MDSKKPSKLDILKSKIKKLQVGIVKKANKKDYY